MRIKTLWTALVLLVAFQPLASATQGKAPKSELRVLFVGQDPENPKVPFPSLANDTVSHTAQKNSSLRYRIPLRRTLRKSAASNAASGTFGPFH